MKYDPVNIFSEWAEKGKDEGMAKAHESAVLEMLEFIYDAYNSPFSFIDAGCGNGWVVRKILSNSNCKKAIGVDGSKKMIEKALLKDPNGNYYCDDLLEWKPNQKVDVVHSMEVFYYFKNPTPLYNATQDTYTSLTFLSETSLCLGGRAIFALKNYPLLIVADIHSLDLIHIANRR